MYTTKFIILTIWCLWSGISTLPLPSSSPSSPLPKREGRLSIADWDNYNEHEPAGPGTYAFGYDIEDPETDNVQFRNEERLANGTVTGSYGYLQPDGNIHTVTYIADHLGYRATVETRPRDGQLKPLVVSDDSLAVENEINIEETGLQEDTSSENQRIRRPFKEQNNYQFIQDKYFDINNKLKQQKKHQQRLNYASPLALNNNKQINYIVSNNLAQAYNNGENRVRNNGGGFYDFYYVPTPETAGRPHMYYH